MTDDLVQRLRSNRPLPTLPHEAADRIEQLEREKAVVSDLWEQQKEIALDYLTDCNKAADRIEAQAAEIEWLRVEVKAQYDRGYYDGRKMDAMEERAKIVAWLRAQGEFGSERAQAWGETFAIHIEAGEHLQEQSK